MLKASNALLGWTLSAAVLVIGAHSIQESASASSDARGQFPTTAKVYEGTLPLYRGVEH